MRYLHTPKRIVILCEDTKEEKLPQELALLYHSVALQHGHEVTRLTLSETHNAPFLLRKSMDNAHHLVIFYSAVADKLPTTLLRTLQNAWVEHHTHPARAVWWRRILGLYPRPHALKTARIITLNSLHPWLSSFHKEEHHRSTLVSKAVLEPLGFSTSHTRFGPLNHATLRHRNHWREIIIHFSKRGE